MRDKLNKFKLFAYHELFDGNAIYHNWQKNNWQLAGKPERGRRTLEFEYLTLLFRPWHASAEKILFLLLRMPTSVWTLRIQKIRIWGVVEWHGHHAVLKNHTPTLRPFARDPNNNVHDAALSH